jgi:uncharacterized protein (DUF305 family)
MTRALTLAAVAAIAIGGAPAAAADGVLIAQKTTSDSKTITHQTQIEKTRMRSEIDQNGRKMIMIFDGGAGVMRTIDEQAKTYTEITKADVDRISAQMAGAMAQMQQQLQSLPPEQRARMEAMMQSGRGMIGATAGPPTEYKKVGTDTVGKWRCDKYEGTKKGEKASEVCTVDPSTLGFALGDFEVTKQMAEFFSKMMPQGMESLFRVGSQSPNSFAGLPVRMVSFRNGAPQTVTEMTDVSRQSFPDSLFAVPAGYAKREMPGMRGRQ